MLYNTTTLIAIKYYYLGYSDLTIHISTAKIKNPKH